MDDDLLFQRIQEITLAGQSNAQITAALTPEAEHLFDRLAAAPDEREAPTKTLAKP